MIGYLLLNNPLPLSLPSLALSSLLPFPHTTHCSRCRPAPPTVPRSRSRSSIYIPIPPCPSPAPAPRTTPAHDLRIPTAWCTPKPSPASRSKIRQNGTTSTRMNMPPSRLATMMSISKSWRAVFAPVICILLVEGGVNRSFRFVWGTVWFPPCSSFLLPPFPPPSLVRQFAYRFDFSTRRE